MGTGGRGGASCALGGKLRVKGATMNFWFKIAVTEALSLATLLVQSSGLSDVQKAALEKFVADGQALLAVF